MTVPGIYTEHTQDGHVFFSNCLYLLAWQTMCGAMVWWPSVTLRAVILKSITCFAWDAIFNGYPFRKEHWLCKVNVFFKLSKEHVIWVSVTSILSEQTILGLQGLWACVWREAAVFSHWCELCCFMNKCCQGQSCVESYWGCSGHLEGGKEVPLSGDYEMAFPLSKGLDPGTALDMRGCSHYTNEWRII